MIYDRSPRPPATSPDRDSIKARSAQEILRDLEPYPDDHVRRNVSIPLEDSAGNWIDGKVDEGWTAIGTTFVEGNQNTVLTKAELDESSGEQVKEILTAKIDVIRDSRRKQLGERAVGGPRLTTEAPSLFAGPIVPYDEDPADRARPRPQVVNPYDNSSGR